MKQKNNIKDIVCKKYNKTLRIMKISILLIFISAFNLSAESGYSQDKDISLKLANVYTIENVISEIEKITDYVFIYNEDVVPTLKKEAKVDMNDQSLDEILNQLIKGTDLGYSLSSKQVTLYKDRSKKEYAQITASAPLLIQQQTKKTISGKVVDEKGEPIIGANIIEKGTTNGTITNNNGNFSLIVENNATIIVSYIGYEAQETNTSGLSVFNIVLLEDLEMLEEVVVVGYGTQKVINLSGSVDVITSKDIINRPVSNAAQSLQGLAPNLNIMVGNEGGELDAKNTINIRGIGSISGSGGTPYILIDGIEGDLYNINPSDIESISVLKDASASAIYGARAAFGVIIISTKKGRKDGVSINYSNNLSLSGPASLPKTANSIKWAEYFNLASVNDGGSPPFSDETIENMRKYQAGELKDWTEPAELEPMFWKSYRSSWANTDWYKTEFKQWSPKSFHNLSISGGDSKNQFYVSGSTFDQKGLMRYGDDNFERNNLNAKVNTEINSWLRASFMSKFNRTIFERPSHNLDLWYHNIGRRWPTNALYTPDGNLNYSMEQIWLKEGGRAGYDTNELTLIPGIEIEPIKDLIISANYRWRMNTENAHDHQAKITVQLADGQYSPLRENNSYQRRQNESYYSSPNIYLNYNKEIRGHTFTLLAGYEQEVTNYRSSTATIEDLISDNVPSLNTGTGRERVSGGQGHWATQSFFGRLNYNLHGKYLLELSARRDGSSKFGSGHQWGNFPSASIAYIISEEPFWESLINHFNLFKIRASYGALGNQDIANYLFVETLPISRNLPYILGSVRPNYAGMSNLTSPGLTWEKVNTTNVGVDIGLFNRKLTGSFDYYIRNTLDMLGPAESLPAVLGTAIPQSNNASLRTKGFEAQVVWNDKIGQVSYTAKFMLSNAKTTVLEYYNPSKLLSAAFYPGKRLGEIWGYETTGLFQTDEELNSIDQSYLSGEQWRLGDVHYADLNNDGKIDIGKNTLEEHGDLKVIGNNLPQYSYSFLFGSSWKGFDLNMLWQGVAKRDLWLSGPLFFGGAGGLWNAVVLEQHFDYWTPENQNAYFPIPYLEKGGKNQQIQTRYLQNGAYLRLKSLQIGYSFPESLIHQAFMNHLKIFVVGENLFTFTKLAKDFDPEGTFGAYGSGKVYPIQRTVSIGINLTF